MRPNIQEQIEQRIESFDDSYIFSSKDFLDISDHVTIGVALSRIAKSGKIQKIINGLYYKPVYIELIKEYSIPSIDDIAKALARKFNWTISPSGDYSLNILHLSTQVPNTYEYVSSGPNREYIIRGKTLIFKNVRQGVINGFHPDSILLVQAIQSLGKNRLEQDEIKILKGLFTKQEKKIILDETKYAPNWIYEIIKEICEDGKYD